MSKVLTGNETVSIVGNFAKSKATLKEIASFAVVDGGVTEEFVTEAVKPKADKVYVDAELSKKANASALNKAGVGLGNVDNTSDANKPVSTAQKTALDLKADKTSLNKSGVGLGNVDNTADSAKPVSVAQKKALDEKANVKDISKITRSAIPENLTSLNVDFNELDFGEYVMGAIGDGSTHAPPKASFYYVEVICTVERSDGTFNILQRAWDFYTGNLFVRARTANKWSVWTKIGTQLPETANEGEILMFKGGKWVSAPMPEMVQPAN